MKKAFSLLLILCMIFGLVGCANDDTEYSVTVAIDGIPKSLDPQIAESASELAVVYNSCEGLMRFDPDGPVTYGAAETHSVSGDGLTYTFKLRQNLKWSDGKDLTADDFLFGIQRAVSPETRCPSVESFYSIKGAREIALGEADISTLGVTAQSGSVTVELCFPDEDILRTLALAAAMPCRRDFFEGTKGKYGLNDDSFVSSGPFYVKKWSQSTESVSLRISSNPEYGGAVKVKPASVVMFFNNGNDHITEISEGQLGSSYLPAYLYDSAVSKKLNTSVARTENFVLSLNQAAPIFSTEKMRQIFAASIDRSVIESKLAFGCEPLTGIIPEGYMLNNGKYSEISEQSYIPFDQAASGQYIAELDVIKKQLDARIAAETAAKQAYIEAAKEAQKKGEPIPEEPGFEPTPYNLYSPWSEADTVQTDFSIICESSEHVTSVAQAVASCWEKAFGITVSVKPLSPSELESAASTGNYYAAILPLSSSDCSAKTLFYSLASSSRVNPIRFASKEYDDVISGIQQSGATAARLIEAQNILISSAHIVPLFSSSHMIASMQNISNIRFVTPNGYLDFSQALNSDSN